MTTPTQDELEAALDKLQHDPDIGGWEEPANTYIQLSVQAARNYAALLPHLERIISAKQPALVVELTPNTESYKYKASMAMMPLRDWEKLEDIVDDIEKINKILKGEA